VSAAEAETKDPYNRLLAHQSRFRVDAETVRDIALATSGLLVEKFGGPSVRPWQPDGYLAALNFPKRDYSAGHGSDLYRRSVYTHWQRSFLHPALVTFDAPTREECTVNRVTSNTPLQALVMLNEPGMLEAARVLAQHSMEGAAAPVSRRIGGVFARTVGREAAPEELAILLQLHRTALARFRASPEAARRLTHIGEAPVPANTDPVELAAMTTVARAVLNLHETITRD
jgi:hypothetical protein